MYPLPRTVSIRSAGFGRVSCPVIPRRFGAPFEPDPFAGDAVRRQDDIDP